MNQLLVDVTPIIEVIGGEVGVDAELEIPVLVVGDETFRAVAPARVDVTLTNTGAGFVASGTADLPAIAECARCLRDFEMTLHADVEGFYVHPGHERDLPDDQEYGFVEDSAVDIAPAVEAALALEAPFAPLHDPDCKGLCVECGADLNEGPCACPAGGRPSGPFAALQGLLPADESGPEE